MRQKEANFAEFNFNINYANWFRRFIMRTVKKVASRVWTTLCCTLGFELIVPCAECDSD